MYIPTWLIVLTVIILITLKLKKKDRKSGQYKNVDDIETSVAYFKRQIFELVHFDSPHFVDLRDAFNIMEVNYLRLKQRFSHIPEKILEISQNWHRYTEALYELKHARILLDVDMSDKAVDSYQERCKEPSIIKDEVEKKFKTLLGKEWQKLKPDYFKRLKTMKKPSEKILIKYGIGNKWKYYYRNSMTLFEMEEEKKRGTN